MSNYFSRELVEINNNCSEASVAPLAECEHLFVGVLTCTSPLPPSSTSNYTQSYSQRGLRGAFFDIRVNSSSGNTRPNPRTDRTGLRWQQVSSRTLFNRKRQQQHTDAHLKRIHVHWVDEWVAVISRHVFLKTRSRRRNSQKRLFPSPGGGGSCGWSWKLLRMRQMAGASPEGVTCCRWILFTFPKFTLFR